MILELLRWRWNRMRRAKVAAALREVNERLDILTRNSERDFLAVGAKLEDILVRARAKAETLTCATDAVSGQQGQTLADTLDEVARWATQATNSADCGTLLEGLSPVVLAVNAPARSLKHTVRTLRVMGVVTRVESARLGSRASDFAALAGQVGGLAAGIDEKSDVILQAVESMGRLLEETRGTAAQLERRQQAELLRLVAECSIGLQELYSQQERVAAVSQSAQDGYQQVVTVVGDVVVALQVHDSTRQRVEHVRAALAQLVEGVSARPPSAGAEALSRAVELQAAQLREARQVFLDSVARIRAELDRLEETVAGFARLARELSGDSSPSQASGVEKHYAAVGSAIAEWAESRRGLASVAAKVSEACARMSGFVSEIENVGLRTLWLALNAEVQAVRLAESGAVMESVAEGIREVSQGASANAAGVGQGLREVEAAVGRVASGLGDERTAAGQVEAMASRINELGASLHRGNAEGQRMLASIADDGNALSREIAALRQSITVDQVMEQESSACLESLEGAVSQARLAARTSAPEHRSVLIGQVAKTYTMHAEREVHDSFFAGGSQPSKANAEKTAACPNAVSELGDNVELF